VLGVETPGESDGSVKLEFELENYIDRGSSVAYVYMEDCSLVIAKLINQVPDRRDTFIFSFRYRKDKAHCLQLFHDHGLYGNQSVSLATIRSMKSSRAGRSCFVPSMCPAPMIPMFHLLTPSCFSHKNAQNTKMFA
jgi:hypothetical protein